MRSSPSCPKCGSERRVRLHRTSFPEKAFSLAGLYPYKCQDCGLRFRARRSGHESVGAGLSWSRWVTCPRCAGENARRIASEDMTPTWANLLWRKLGIPGYRCPDCRMRFFSIRMARHSGKAT